MSIKSTFLAWIVRMSFIKRWALMLCFREENVSEHSHQTAVIAHMLAVIKNRLYGGKVNAEHIAVLALYHEVSETKLQDLNSRTKYYSPEFTQQFKKLENIAEHECLHSLPQELQEDFKALLVQQEIDPEDKKLVKAADLIAAFIKASEEERFHNPEFAHVKDNLMPRLDAMCQEMPEVKYFMETFTDKCWIPVEQLGNL